MKIGINTLFFKYPASGTGQYLVQLLNQLAEIDTKNKYVLFGDSPKPELEGPLTRFPYVERPVPILKGRKENIEKLVWEQFTGPAAAQNADVDLFHIPYFAPPLFMRSPTIVTIHDVIPLRLPAYQESAKVRAYLKVVSRAARQARLIITISQHAKQDIIETLKIKPDRIRVIYQAAGEEYHPITDMELRARTRAKYGVGERYIFYLGGLDQRKNVPQLVRAFAELYRRLGDPGLQLLIAGNPDKQKGPLFPDPRPVAADLGMTGQIVYRFIDEEDKPTLYSDASAFAFPSLYEGFGLTPLEAMACGAPVICSNRTSLPEVAGDAAISLDPMDTAAWVDAMYNVLTKPELEADLRTRSLERAKWFHWRKTAKETLAAYEEAYARKRGR
ncbi:MAG TPA: glycosyltransferase family 1 protein [Ktedonobacteraceae bacterium]|nr:glycosyltransferase family 1 protein [Ktedonobacteraceae bacterium]